MDDLESKEKIMWEKLKCDSNYKIADMPDWQYRIAQILYWPKAEVFVIPKVFVFLSQTHSLRSYSRSRMKNALEKSAKNDHQLWPACTP